MYRQLRKNDTSTDKHAMIVQKYGNEAAYYVFALKWPETGCVVCI